MKVNAIPICADCHNQPGSIRLDYGVFVCAMCWLDGELQKDERKEASGHALPR